MGRTAINTQEHTNQILKQLTDKEQSAIIARKYYMDGINKPKMYTMPEGVYYCSKISFETALKMQNCLAVVAMGQPIVADYVKIVGPHGNYCWAFSDNYYIKFVKNNDFYCHVIGFEGELTLHDVNVPFGAEEQAVELSSMPKKFADRKEFYSKKNNRNKTKSNIAFVKAITDKQVNPYYGESPTTIWSRNLTKDQRIGKYQELDDIVDRALARGGYQPGSNKKTVYALTKLRDNIFRDYSKEDLPSLNEFVDIICADDLSAIVGGVGMATNLYQTNPVIKDLVDKAIKFGKSKLSQLFNSSQGVNISDDKQLLMHRGADAVNLEHVFGCLTAPLPAVSDPTDIPKLVYSNSFVYEIILTANSTGSVGFCLDPRMYFVSTAATSRFFTAINNATGYNAGTGTGGSWSIAPGPLGTSMSSFTQCKLLGFEVEIVPTVSLNQAEGAMVYGTLMDDFDNLNTVGVCPTQSTPTFTLLSQLNNFVVSDLKCGKVYNRVIPTTDRNYLEWIQSSNGTSINTEYSKFVLLAIGLDPSASISLRFTVKFSILPSIAAQALIRPSIPAMGLYTDYFIEYLRATYPDLPNWSQKDVLEYYESLIALRTDSYSKLTQYSHEPKTVTRKMGLVQ